MKLINSILLFFVCLTQIIYIVYMYITLFHSKTSALVTETPYIKIDQDYFYIIQITDTHLTDNFDSKQDINFLRFLNEVKKYNYLFICHSGDIFDSKNGTKLEVVNKYIKILESIKNENSVYAKKINETGIPITSMRIVNIRGNHDTYFTNPEYSSWINQALYNCDSRHRVINIDCHKKINFNFYDASPIKSPQKWYNFIGNLQSNKIEKSDLNISFCHYPTNVCLFSTEELKNFDWWFCGHLHSFLFFKNVLRIHSKSKIESLLVDFKTSFTYRIITFYKGKVAYSDVQLFLPKIVIMDSFVYGNNFVVKFLVLEYEKVAIFIDGNKFSNFEVKDELFTFTGPVNFTNLEIVATNSFGKFTTTLPKYRNTINSLPLYFPFLYLPFILALIYFYLHIYLSKLDEYYLFALKYFWIFIFPIYRGKFFDSKIASLSNKFTCMNTVDVFYHYLIWSIWFDFGLFLGIKKRWAVYVGMSILHYCLLGSEWGWFYRSEDLAVFLILLWKKWKRK